ncbi:MAG: calcineurin-like phosphoesterase C-terminal domain-containing protein, partial [Candidatus Cryptobacteroides sp.]
MNSRKQRSIYMYVAVLMLQILCISCAGNDVHEESVIDVNFSIPERLEIAEGDNEISFRIMFGKAPLETDIVVLTDSWGKEHDCHIISVESKTFAISLFDGVFSDTYEVGIRRGKEYRLIGKMLLSVQTAGLDLEEGVTVYGTVSCDDGAIPGAVISDGVEAVRTDENGYYQLKSAKKYGYVFISIPEGYEVSSEGILPVLHKKLLLDEKSPEKVDFELYDAGNQDNYTLLVMGDMHLANRTNDRTQFSYFVNDVNEYVSGHPNEKIYGITLGDMTWDLYWYSNNYQFKEYLNDINKINGIDIFHTIGNHDHEMNAAGDFDTILKYTDIIAPDYYSFNIGDIHYVILDNIKCTNSGNGDRTYDTMVSAEQLEWLKKDLSFVPKNKTIMVAMHATTGGTSNISSVTSLLSGYKSVHFITGHSHRVSNTDKNSYYDHNSGAVCATWWWTGKNTDNAIHIGQDGAPGGYQIFNISGTDLKWQYKATGSKVDYQFRTYDRNSINLSSDRYLASAYEANKENFDELAKDWSTVSNNNEVYINIWNHDPNWTIEVTENGKRLEASRVTVMDPLHLLSYCTFAYNNSSKAVSPTFKTSDNSHTFKVVASSPSSTLEIKVTDRFGNVYTETMTRP